MAFEAGGWAVEGIQTAVCPVPGSAINTMVGFMGFYIGFTRFF